MKKLIVLISHERSGYILVLCLMLLSVMILMVTQLLNRSSTQLYFNATMIHREQAQALAYGGFQLAMEQLMLAETTTSTAQEKSTETKETEKKKDPKKEFLQTILPILNRWQKFELKEDVDGIDAQVHISISCEQGKIDVNQWYNFEQHTFNQEKESNNAQQIFKNIFGSLKKFIKDKDLYEQFEKFLKQRQYKLDDATEFLVVKEFQDAFKVYVFYEPMQVSAKKEQRPVYLTDLFTVFSGTQSINPWVLSDSVEALYGLKRNQTDDIKAYTKQVNDTLKSVDQVDGDLEKVWDSALAKWYGREFKSLPKDLVSLLNTQVVPTTFYIRVKGIVNKIVQELCAIVERQESSSFIVRKVYWL